MKTKSDFILQEVAGSFVIMPTGAAAVNFNGMMTVNEVGALLWKKLSGGATEEELVAAVLSEYDVAEDVAKRDVHAFIGEMERAGVLE